jgi:hypothetical protein
MIGDITNTSPCPPKRGGFYRRGQLDREQLASSHPMKQQMPRAPYSQLATMDFAKSPTIFYY